jgi:hypothetical protein
LGRESIFASKERNYTKITDDMQKKIKREGKRGTGAV